MTTEITQSIDLGKLGDQIRHYERQWIAVASDNSIVGHGVTYREALDDAKQAGLQDVILFKVPPLDYSFAPAM